MIITDARCILSRIAYSCMSIYIFEKAFVTGKKLFPMQLTIVTCVHMVIANGSTYQENITWLQHNAGPLCFKLIFIIEEPLSASFMITYFVNLLIVTVCI